MERGGKRVLHYRIQKDGGRSTAIFRCGCEMYIDDMFKQIKQELNAVGVELIKTDNL